MIRGEADQNMHSPDPKPFERIVRVAEEELLAGRDRAKRAQEDALAVDDLVEVGVRGVVDEPAEAGGDEEPVADAELVAIGEVGAAVGDGFAANQHADHLQHRLGRQIYPGKDAEPGTRNGGSPELEAVVGLVEKWKHVELSHWMFEFIIPATA